VQLVALDMMEIRDILLTSNYDTKGALYVRLQSTEH
jgi:hypothetical protein